MLEGCIGQITEDDRGSEGGASGLGGRPSTTGTAGTTGTTGTTTTTGSGGATSTGGSGGATLLDASSRDAGGVFDGSARDVFVADRGTNPQGVLFHVANHCPFDLWVHAAGQEGILQPDNAELRTGATQDYIAPDHWSAGRVTAYLGQPPQNEIDKVEITTTVQFGAKVINYNITYVDWVGLPIEMVSIGGGGDCKRVGCYVQESAILSGCPDGLLADRRCLSAGKYCAIATNQSKPFCHALDAKIAECAQDSKYVGCSGASGTTTPQVYGCSAFFGGSPKWCAALNRGMLADPDNANISLYYKTTPYNNYSKWVHTVCPGIYAFPFDDYAKTNESGFHSCINGSQLNITFCPAG